MEPHQDFAAQLAPLISDTIFARHVHHDVSVTSTNTLAMEAAANGAPEGTVFLADEQTAGRGRGGHSWSSELGTGVYCSALLRPKLASADALILSLVAGLAVRAAVQECGGVEADLRWPNDVMLGEKKFCGILCEASHGADAQMSYCVIGIGINVNQSRFDEELAPIATSLRLHSGREWSRVALAAALLKSLHREYSALSADYETARASVLRRFAEHSSYAIGAAVHVGEEDGYDGTTAGLDDRGFLKVQTAEGMKTVLSGGVRKLRP